MSTHYQKLKVPLILFYEWITNLWMGYLTFTIITNPIKLPNCDHRKWKWNSYMIIYTLIFRNILKITVLLFTRTCAMQYDPSDWKMN